MTTVTEDRLLTVRDVAQLLAMSTRNIWRLKSAGRLPPAIKIGGAVRWDRADIARHLDALKRTHHVKT